PIERPISPSVAAKQTNTPRNRERRQQVPSASRSQVRRCLSCPSKASKQLPTNRRHQGKRPPNEARQTPSICALLRTCNSARPHPIETISYGISPPTA